MVRGARGDSLFGFCGDGDGDGDGDGGGICVWWGLWIERLGGWED